VPTVPDESFTIKYDGPALAGNRMDVRQLTSALISLSDAVQAAHAVASPLQPPPALHITATVPGSFSVDLMVVEAAAIAEAVDLLTSPEAQAAGTLVGVGGPIVGLLVWAISLVKKRRTTRPVGDPLPLGDVRPGWVRVTWEDHTSLEVPSAAVRLADDLPFRKAMSGVVEPLRQPGIEDLAFLQDSVPKQRIVKEDVPAFAAPVVEEEPLSDSTSEVVLRPLTVAFRPGNKWRVTDGSRELRVVLADVDFRGRIETNVEAFGAGDLLRCELRTQQWRKPDGDLRTEHTVLRVLDHQRGPREVPLPFDGLDDIDTDDD
jgi:hypothetical protein